MAHFGGKTYCGRTKVGIVSDAGDALAEPVVHRAPTHAEIAQLAHAYWEARGRQGGSPEEDWLRAERELWTRDRG